MIHTCCVSTALAWSIAIILPTALAAADSAWIERAPLPSARTEHLAVLLLDGTVLVAGGYGAQGHGSVSSSDVYDFRKNVWLRHAEMQFAHAAVDSFALLPLQGGRVLAISPNWEGKSRSEEYDAIHNAWRPIAALPDQRYLHRAVALPNGDVLVVGGVLLSDPLSSIASCLLYHAASNTWTVTGSMATSREDFTLDLLKDGRVLAIGGITSSNGAGNVLRTCEVYLPDLGVWQPAGELTSWRDQHQSCVLDNGDVLIAGGNVFSPLTSERYLHTTQTAVTTNRCSVAFSRAFTAVRGGALRAGGASANSGDNSSAAVDIFSTRTRTWSPGPSLPAPRRGAPAVTLPSGEVLVIGGSDSYPGGGDHVFASTELYALRPYFTQANAQTSGTVGRTFSYQLDAATIATYTSVGLPPGIALNKVTGHLGGKPTTAGSYNVRIGATNEFGKSLMYLSLTIAPAQPPGSAAPEAPQGGG